MIHVLVAGADSQIGRDLVRVLAVAGYEAVGRTRDQLDVTDRSACRRAIRDLGPEMVIDCTAEATSGQDGGNAGQPDSYRIGADNLAAGARGIQAFSVYLSCADVFDGAADDPYVESDPPNPVTAFGAAKLDAERTVARTNPRHAIVRSTWLFGMHGRSFVDDLLEAARGADRVPVDAEVRSSPTYTVDLATALVALVRHPALGIFHLAAEGICTRLQFARALFRASGIDGEPVPAVENEQTQGGVQAGNLVLGTRREELPRLPEWRLGLSAYLEERTGAGRPVGWAN